MSSPSLNQLEEPFRSVAAEHGGAFAQGAAAARHGFRRCFFRSGSFTMIAIITAVGSLLTFMTLPWTQQAIFGNTNPAIWIAIGLLVPMSLLCFSVYRDYWIPQKSGQDDTQRLGPYVLIEKLGSGGMGDVFLAEHQLMKRHCAVKLIHPQHARDRRMRQSFEREAKATAQLTHWNTIEIYDYGTSADGRFYYVMEYLKGVNLWHYVERYGPMPPGRIVYILKQLCDALYEADCAGLVHRDIKPSNIFLTERGKSFDVVKLLDFGLVQTITKDPVKVRNVSTKLHGSPSFMCPEQAVGLTPDSRGDLYSLGAVAYFLLTGRPPFVDDNPIMLIVAHATTTVPTFEEIGAAVPADLGAVVLRCLSRDPASRFASFRELREVLEDCASSGEWTWKAAEDWWQEHSPAPPLIPPEPPTMSEDTMLYDRDTAAQLPALSAINHEEPTAIVERPSELQAV